MNNDLETRFIELRNENSKYSIRVLELERELYNTKELLNNALNFHCPYFLTSGSGVVSCHHDKEQELLRTRELLERANAIIHHVVCSAEDSQGLAYEYLELNKLLKDKFGEMKNEK